MSVGLPPPAAWVGVIIDGGDCRHLEDELDHRTAEIMSLRRADAEGPSAMERRSNDENAPPVSGRFVRGPFEVDLTAINRFPGSQDTTLRPTSSDALSETDEVVLVSKFLGDLGSPMITVANMIQTSFQEL